jgi:hypothetical protein
MHEPPPLSEAAADAPGAASCAGETAFLYLAAGIGLFSWVAVVLAEIGWLRAGGMLLGLGVTLSVLWGASRLRASFRPGRGGGPGRHDGAAGGGSARLAGARKWRPHLAPVLGAALVLLVAAAAFLPPFESVLWASDATVYLAFGSKLAETGSLRFDDPLLAELPVAARQALFRNPVAGDVTGLLARFPGGFLIPEVSEPEVTAGFAPLFPVLLALAWGWLGRAAALHVAPLFGLLAVAAVGLVGRRLAGGPAGLLAALLLAVSLPQIWFARLSMAEVVAELFVFAGLLALLVSCDAKKVVCATPKEDAGDIAESPRLAAAGGALFGLAVLAKLELIVVLPAAVGGFAAVALVSESESLRRRVRYFALPFFLLVLHGVIHLFALPSHYRPFLFWKLERLGAGRLLGVPAAESLAPAAQSLVPAAQSLALVAGLAAGGVVALAVLSWWLLSGGRSKARAAGIAAALVLWAAVYAAASTNRLAETVPWLGWYLSWPVVAAFFAGAAAAWRRAGRPDRAESTGDPASEDRAALSFVLVLVAVAGFASLYDPQEPASHIWSVRRLVPIVLPGMLLVVAAGVAALAAWLPARRRWVAVPIAVSLIVLVGRPALVIAGATPWAGAVKVADDLAGRLPAGSVLLVSSDLSGTHLATTLGYGYDRDAILLQPGYADPTMLEDLVIEWLGAGRAVFLLIGDGATHLPAPRLALSPIAAPLLRLRMLEVTTARRPTRLLEERLQLHLFQVKSAGGKRTVDVGSLAEDILFDMRGFHAPERDDHGGTFRWTQALASIDLPGAGERIRIVLSGERPQGAPPARISIHVDGRLAIEDLGVAATPQTIVVEGPGQGAGAKPTLTIETTAFRPSDLGLSADDRQLGVKVYRIEY